ncbi:replication protein P [Neptunomonas phycophila]|uniref:replication protein P n=1 Tax=Neptunomonas phycophila TaxID=1572645 RepID=UPI002015EFC8|nr:replication protein P [Neptunomonas phycophila]
MKTPAEILKKTENGLPQPSWTSKTPIGSESQASATPEVISLETKAMVNMIFARFMAIYGHKFKSCFETQDEIRIAKREWALSLTSYDESQLVRAVDRCKETLAWMPTVSEFLKILEEVGAGDGIPSVRAAYIEACRFSHDPVGKPWSHPVVYHAGRETGWFALKSEEERTTFGLFRYHYELVCRRFRAGESFDIPQPKGVTDNRDATLYAFIKQWSESQSITQEQASSLLYYLTKPEGTRVRASLKKQAMEQAARLGIDELPDQVGSVN